MTLPSGGVRMPRTIVPDYGWKGNALDSKDARPVRPRLFETGAPAAGVSAPESTAPGHASRQLYDVRRPRPLRWLALAVLVVAAGAGVAWWWSSPDAAGSGAHSSTAPLMARSEPSPVPDTAAAVLVQDPDVGATGAPDPLATLGNRAEAQATATPASTASTAARADAGGANSTSAPPPGAARSRPPASTAPPLRAARPASAGASPAAETDLLATLLANIRDRPADKRASGEPQTLDELIAQLRQRDPGTVRTPGAAGTEQGSARLQTRLRNCPAANTVDGIRCRQRLCAQYRGDPACPPQ